MWRELNEEWIKTAIKGRAERRRKTKEFNFTTFPLFRVTNARGFSELRAYCYLETHGGFSIKLVEGRRSPGAVLVKVSGAIATLVTLSLPVISIYLSYYCSFALSFIDYRCTGAWGLRGTGFGVTTARDCWVTTEQESRIFCMLLLLLWMTSRSRDRVEEWS